MRGHGRGAGRSAGGGRPHPFERGPAPLVACLLAGLVAACGASSAAATAHGPALVPATAVPVTAAPATTTPVTTAPATTAPATTAPATFYDVPHHLAPAPAGTLVRTERLAPAGLPTGARAWRVLYHSRSPSGADLVVSGLVAVPGGPPPAGGFPVVSWAHGTTGLADRCAPSHQGTPTLPWLDSLLRQGDIVAASDYPGLGTPGIHPYLVGGSEARGVLDAARAARTLAGPSASRRLAVVGFSQGGQAALFAGQLAPTYAPELTLVGVAALAPVTSLARLAPAVPGPGTSPDTGFAAMALASWSATYGTPDVADVLTARARAEVSGTACSSEVGTLLDATPTDQVFRPDWRAAPDMEAEIVANRPGALPTRAPVLVLRGTADQVVSAAATTDFVGVTLCTGDGDRAQLVSVPGASHAGLVTAAGPAVLAWLGARFAGVPVAPGCPPQTFAGG